MANMSEQTSATTREFTFDLLKQITNNFSEEHVIGRGAFGEVYKGVLDNGEEIALKKLYHNQGLDDTQFRNEFNNLMRAQHQNITRLVGYCYYLGHQRIKYNGEYIFALVEERILCFEYLQGGSLDKHISDESRGLDWHTRFKIIRGVSEGLNYLHNGCKDPIYHLDLKPENILLDKNMVPKIGDFGLSRLFPSSQTCITSKVMGTVGYMPPEYIDRREITSKFDVFSLGVIIIRIVAGYDGYSKCASMSSQGFLEHVHENWGKQLQGTNSLQTSEQVKRCIEIALKCVEVDRVKRPTITEIVDELNKLDATKSSPIGQNTEKLEHTTLENEADIQENITKSTKEQVEIRMKNNMPTQLPKDLHKISGDTLAPRSQWNGSMVDGLHDNVLHLKSGLQRLRETLPVMYNLIDVAEWKSHENFVAMLFPKLKDAVYDADDLLDEFRWHEMKVKLEGNAKKPPFIDFIDTIIQGSFNKLNDVQERLDHLSNKLEKMGLHVVTQRFDKAVRPETSSLPNEEKTFGREKELKHVMKLLSVPTDSKRKRATCLANASASTSPRNQVSNESRITCVPVLPVVGIGGVGKTTLAQHICSHEQVKSHFELVIWICVSDDFDVKRLTREVVESCPGKMIRTNNLDSLQRALSNRVNNKRLLIVLDDMWDDALKENGQCWKRFCAPLLSAKEGSMMLVTTRCPKVANGVGTMNPFILEGLNDDVFWNFFRLCAFGSESFENDPELEIIGQNILPKLKGSPLAAKTLGRMLRMDLQASRWNAILESELWKLPQEATEILPALRLSYMYLPFYLKQCFSFCAVYPKDYKFRKEDLAEIWVAEGFVEPQGDNPIQDIAFQYFEDLVARSFFQKVSGGYIIHDLLHDMAQKVSEHDCFILRNKQDFYNVPPNVRHIYVHPSSDFDYSDLLSLCKHPKLRTLICKESGKSLMDSWCSKLLRIRVMSCASTNELPDSIGNLKHLRYLKISEGCSLIIPPSFRLLYNLQILDVKTCKIESLPNGFSNLRNLQRFVAQGFFYNPVATCYINAAEQVWGIKFMKNLDQFRGHLEISNVHMLCKDDATGAKLKNKKDLSKLTLNWSDSQVMQHNAIEVLQALQPPISLRSLLLSNYPGVSVPSWFPASIQLQMWSFPDLQELKISSCRFLTSIGASTSLPLCTGMDNIRAFSKLKSLEIIGCNKLSTIDDFLTQEYLPTIETINVTFCEGLVTLPGETFGSFRSLKHLYVRLCPCLNWQRGLVLPSSLQTLELYDCGDFSACVPGCLENLTSLVSLKIRECEGLTSIPDTIWRNNLALLEELVIDHCPNLVSIGGAEAVAKIKTVEIHRCLELKEAPQIWRRGRWFSRINM
ncbi:unnamed protein product [Alopecurus aequalis]